MDYVLTAMTIITPCQVSKDLDGKRTEIVLQTFADRILVLITQMGKVGNLIQATIPATTALLPAPPPDPSQPNVQTLPPPPAAIQLTPLLGNAPSEHIQILHSLYAAQIATILWTAESSGPLEVHRRSVVIGIALCQSSRSDINLNGSESAVFAGVMSMLQELVNRK